MSISLDEISRQMGGSPVPSFLSKAERGLVPMPREAATKLARILHLPEAEVLRAYGHVPPEEAEAAVRRLAGIIAESPDIPRVVEFPQLDLSGHEIGKVRRMIHGKVSGFIVELSGPANAPFAGEVLVYTDRMPANGQGVVVEINGVLSGWTYNQTAGKTWIENGRREKRASGYRIKGVIAQVRTIIDLIPSGSDLREGEPEAGG